MAVVDSAFREWIADFKELNPDVADNRAIIDTAQYAFAAGRKAQRQADAANCRNRTVHTEQPLGMVAAPGLDVEDLLAIVTKARLVLHAKGVTGLAERLRHAHDGLAALLTGGVKRTNLRMTPNWFGQTEENDR